MSRTLRSEAIKLTTTRTALGFGITALVLAVGQTALLVGFGDPTALDDKRSAVSASHTTTLILLVFGAVAAAGEFRHGTIASAFLAQPRRLELTVARLLAYAATGLMVGVVVQGACFAVGLAMLGDSGGDPLGAADLLEILGGVAASSALAAALGGAIGSLLRNQIAAVVAILAFSFIVETSVGVADDDLVKYMPGTALSAAGGEDFGFLLPQGLAAMVAFGWTALFAALAAVADQRRDV